MHSMVSPGQVHAWETFIPGLSKLVHKGGITCASAAIHRAEAFQTASLQRCDSTQKDFYPIFG